MDQIMLDLAGEIKRSRASQLVDRDSRQDSWETLYLMLRGLSNT